MTLSVCTMIYQVAVIYMAKARVGRWVPFLGNFVLQWLGVSPAIVK